MQILYQLSYKGSPIDNFTSLDSFEKLNLLILFIPYMQNLSISQASVG